MAPGRLSTITGWPKVRRSAGSEADDDANRLVELVLRDGARTETGKHRNERDANNRCESCTHRFSSVRLDVHGAAGLRF
jgi:hypothetical protein